MAEAHDLLFAGELVLGPATDALGGPVLDGAEQGEHALVGAAVQRAGERADGRGHRGVGVRQGRAGHTSGEGRGVHRVFGVQGERDVHHLHGQGARLFTLEHVEEVLGVAEVETRLDRVVPAPDAMPCRDDRRQLGH